MTPRDFTLKLGEWSFHLLGNSVRRAVVQSTGETDGQLKADFVQTSGHMCLVFRELIFWNSTKKIGEM